jgi:hypothetical protein
MKEGAYPLTADELEGAISTMFHDEKG